MKRDRSFIYSLSLNISLFFFSSIHEKRDKMSTEVTNANINSCNLTSAVSKQDTLEVRRLIKRGQRGIKDALFEGLRI